MWLRYVLLPGVTDAPDEIARLAEFATGLGNVQQIELLPFHQLGRFKWERLGIDYACRDAVPPVATQIEEATAIFRAAGLEVH